MVSSIQNATRTHEMFLSQYLDYWQEIFFSFTKNFDSRFTLCQRNWRNEMPRSIDSRYDQERKFFFFISYYCWFGNKTATILSHNNYSLHMSLPVRPSAHGHPKSASERRTVALEGSMCSALGGWSEEVLNSRRESVRLGWRLGVSRVQAGELYARQVSLRYEQFWN